MKIPKELVLRISKIESKDRFNKRKNIAKKCKDTNYIIEVASKNFKKFCEQLYY